MTKEQNESSRKRRLEVFPKLCEDFQKEKDECNLTSNFLIKFFGATFINFIIHVFLPTASSSYLQQSLFRITKFKKYFRVKNILDATPFFFFIV